MLLFYVSLVLYLPWDGTEHSTESWEFDNVHAYLTDRSAFYSCVRNNATYTSHRGNKRTHNSISCLETSRPKVRSHQLSRPCPSSPSPGSSSVPHSASCGNWPRSSSSRSDVPRSIATETPVALTFVLLTNPKLEFVIERRSSDGTLKAN